MPACGQTSITPFSDIHSSNKRQACTYSTSIAHPYRFLVQASRNSRSVCLQPRIASLNPLRRRWVDRTPGVFGPCTAPALLSTLSSSVIDKFSPVVIKILRFAWRPILIFWIWCLILHAAREILVHVKNKWRKDENARSSCMFRRRFLV